MDNKDKMTKQEIFWLFWLLLLIVLGIFTSCKTKYVTVPEYHSTIVTKHDTLIRRDSIFEKDSVFVYRNGDTIAVYKWKVLYKDRWRDKIIYRDSIKVDSIRVPYPVERQATWWEKTWMRTGKILSGFLVIIILGFMMWLLARGRI